MHMHAYGLLVTIQDSNTRLKNLQQQERTLSELRYAEQQFPSKSVYKGSCSIRVTSKQGRILHHMTIAMISLDRLWRLLWWLVTFMFYASDGGKWAVRVSHSPDAEETALSACLVVIGAVGALENTFLMENDLCSDEDVDVRLKEHASVVWYEKQVKRRRVRRGFAVHFIDPAFPQQWHLVRNLECMHLECVQSCVWQ